VIRRLHYRLLPGLVLYLLSQASFGQTAISCADQKISYTTFDAKFAKQIQLKPLEKSYQEPADSDKQFSPQHTTWFVQTEPDYTKSSPWTTSVVISARPGSKAFRLTVVDHANSGVTVQWLNQKLLFVQIWWDRMVSTDAVFDTEKGQFLYREMANYGQVMEPCE
jgi:hypothetical protein